MMLLQLIPERFDAWEKLKAPRFDYEGSVHFMNNDCASLARANVVRMKHRRNPASSACATLDVPGIVERIKILLELRIRSRADHVTIQSRTLDLICGRQCYAAFCKLSWIRDRVEPCVEASSPRMLPCASASVAPTPDAAIRAALDQNDRRAATNRTAF